MDFVEDTINGKDHIVPSDDATNIANPENYYPDYSELVFGGPVLTNPTNDPQALARSIWDLRLGQAFFKEYYSAVSIFK